MKTSHTKIFLWVTGFALAMGFLETAVVVYLRQLYYPDGFQFPLRSMPPLIAQVELTREAATILMLVAVGYLSGKTALQRFAWFTFAFAVWDLMYYAGLYLCLGWPVDLNTWDILFLIPVPWVGPVWSACIIALLMVVGSMHVIIQTERNPVFRISRSQWFVLFSGISICLLAFMWDYLSTHSLPFWTNCLSGQEDLFSDMNTYIPHTFNTPVFLCGFLLMCAPIFLSVYQSLKLK